jgi:hypothetical protein
MQGFVGQRTFTVDSHPPQVDSDTKESMELSDFGVASPSKAPTAAPTPADTKGASQRRPSESDFDITVISRRSVNRAGLRYLRRGVDEDGHVANAVETEQIFSPGEPREGEDIKSSKVYSFIQIRGSIPVFFTQTPYSLKPVPVLQHSEANNMSALRKHLAGLQKRYGSLQLVNLVEKHGNEAAVGAQYEKYMQKFIEEVDAAGEGSASEKVRFEWFDFHAACRGMKFENVSILLQTLSSTLDGFGSSISADGESPVSRRQNGVLRTNCMDCLDRTNVCQSFFAKYMLDQQLREQGFDMREQLDQECRWFNTLWADNGDAISNQYASTAAMKGDYTRTRKRDYRGALTDAGLSLTRLFNG